MTPLEELARALEAYVMPNRMGDAIDLATTIDSFVRDRAAMLIKNAMTPAQRTSETRFNRIEPLKVNGVPYAELSTNGFLIHVAINEEDFDTFSVGAARAIYEWLGRALPPQAERP
jgi:hypothetical protein